MCVFIPINTLQLTDCNMPKDICEQGDLFSIDFGGNFYCFSKANEVHCNSGSFGVQKLKPL